MANTPSSADIEKAKLIYGKVSLSLENCILPDEKLNPSPSEVDGLTRDTETDLRILGCELIQTSGVLLRLPQVAMATGQVLFQRFYYSKSFVRHAMEVVAMACVTLASKIEEAPRRIRDCINVFHHIKQVKAGKTIQPLILDQNYINLKNQVIKAERRVLKELGFCVHVKHPHKIIVTLLEVLKVKNHLLMQTAWNYMNDSLRSEVFVRFPPETIACACIYLSARVLQIPLPNKPAWFLIFSVTEEDLNAICHIILELYTFRKPDPEKLEKHVEEVKRKHTEAKLKAKGLASAALLSANHVSSSPTSLQSSPKNGKASPLDMKKDDHNKNNNSSPKSSSRSLNHRKRTHSPKSNDVGSPHNKKKSRSSSSPSVGSRTPSPRRKHHRTPPRSFKDSRSRLESKNNDPKKSKHKSSTHKRKRSRSRSLTPVGSPHKHSSSKRSYKSVKNSNKHDRSPPPPNRMHEHNHHNSVTSALNNVSNNSHEKSHKSSHKPRDKSSSSSSTHHSKSKSRR